MTASGMALSAPIPSPTVGMEFCGAAIRALILSIVGFFGDPQQHSGVFTNRQWFSKPGTLTGNRLSVQGSMM
jgi:hypothetical protein